MPNFAEKNKNPGEAFPGGVQWWVLCFWNCKSQKNLKCAFQFVFSPSPLIVMQQGNIGEFVFQSKNACVYKKGCMNSPMSTVYIIFQIKLINLYKLKLKVCFYRLMPFLGYGRKPKCMQFKSHTPYRFCQFGLFTSIWHTLLNTLVTVYLDSYFWYFMTV